MRAAVAFARALVFGIAATSHGPSLGAPQDASAEPVSFARQVLPILRMHCQGCHQPARARGGVELMTHDDLVSEQENDPFVVPGDPAASPLLQLCLPRGDEPPRMPKGREPLDAAALDVLARWIAEGAACDAEVESAPEAPEVYPRAPIVRALAYSRDGAELAVAGWREVLLHASDGSAIRARLRGLAERIEALEYSPDGSRLAAVGGTPGRMGEVQIWSPGERSLQLARAFGADSLFGVGWSPDGALVAFGSTESVVRAIDAATGRLVLYQGAHEDFVTDVCFSTDGSHLVSVSRDRTMKLIHVATAQFIDDVTSITPGALKGGLLSVDRHPTRDELLVGGADGRPKTYRMYREKRRKIGDDFNLVRGYGPLPGRLFAVAYAPDGERIAVGLSDGRWGEVHVRATEDGAFLWHAHLDAPVYALAHHPSGRELAVGSGDGFVTRFATDTGEVLGRFAAVPLAATETARNTEDAR